MIAVQGDFYGSALPSLHIEATLAAHVARHRFRQLAEFYAQRWWDYRMLSPGHSFLLFAHHYYRGVRIASRKFVKENPQIFLNKKVKRPQSILGSSITQMEVQDIWERDKAHITGMWNAMLIADSFGIPYDEFVKLACRVAFDRQWKHIPRSTQLYSEKLTPFVLDEWDESRKTRAFFAKHPIYDIDNYAGLPVQDAYRRYVIEAIEVLDKPLNGLMDAVFYRRQIPEDMARQHFPAQLVNRAKSLAS